MQNAIFVEKDLVRAMGQLKKENHLLKSQLHAVVRSLPGSIYYKDKEGVYLGANDHALKMVGLHREEDIIGKTDFDLFTAEEAKKFREVDLQVMRTRQEISREERVISPDGQSLIQLSIKKPLIDHEDHVIGILGNTIDVTRMKETEHQLLIAKEQTERVQYQLEGAKLISGSIAHEIRTPLATIKSAMQGINYTLSKLIPVNAFVRNKNLAIATVKDPEIMRMKEAINSVSKKVDQSNMINNMLLTKLQGIDFEFSEFAISTASHCIQDAINEFIVPENMTNKINFNNDNDFEFLGSRTLVMHVIMNLLKNAIFYILKADRGEIIIWLEQHKKFNEIHFKDTGTGISEQVLPHIFDSFFTTESSTGTGVGLAFSKMVMQSHQGEINCISKEGEYTEFVLSFPILDNKQS